jgi:predicted RNase H-like HicB family nuclease
LRYRVNLKKSEEGYAIWVPGLPGCWSQGKTEEKALENVRDAIKEYLKTAEELSKGQLSRHVEIRQEGRRVVKCGGRAAEPISLA